MQKENLFFFHFRMHCKFGEAKITKKMSKAQAITI